MQPLPIRPASFLTDEDVFAAVAPAMRSAGFDAVSIPEISRLGASDESQLTFAAQERRVLVTFNVSHFAALHASWLSQGHHHAGIVASSQRPIGDLLKRLLHLARSLDELDFVDRLVFLSDW